MGNWSFQQVFFFLAKYVDLKEEGLGPEGGASPGWRRPESGRARKVALRFRCPTKHVALLSSLGASSWNRGGGSRSWTARLGFSCASANGQRPFHNMTPGSPNAHFGCAMAVTFWAVQRRAVQWKGVQEKGGPRKGVLGREGEGEGWGSRVRPSDKKKWRLDIL